MKEKEVTICEKIFIENSRSNKINSIARDVVGVILKKEISLIEAGEVLEKADRLLKESVNHY